MWICHRVTGPARKPAPAWAFHRVTASRRALPLAPVCVPSQGYRTDICCIVDLHGLQGDNLYHYGLRHMLQGNLFSSAWSIFCLSFFTDLALCIVVSFTYSHSSLPGVVGKCFLPLVKNVSTEALPTLLIGSSLASSESVLEPAETGSVCSQKPPLQPALYQNLAT